MDHANNYVFVETAEGGKKQIIAKNLGWHITALIAVFMYYWIMCKRILPLNGEGCCEKYILETWPSGATRTQLHELPPATCVQHVGICYVCVCVCDTHKHIIRLVLAVCCSALFKHIRGCRVLWFGTSLARNTGVSLSLLVYAGGICHAPVYVKCLCECVCV